ncbi:MAG: glycosyltransferase family 2 protein [Pseudonocardia sp.]|nr:glycosyltransferase family 2 protein [Pseudonocardia sp.]
MTPPRIRPIGAVGVVVPAHDEQERIGACLDAVAEALDALPDAVRTAVCVVLDRCTDGTAERARAALPQADHVLTRRRRTVGEVRNLGIGRLLDRLGDVPAERTWLLSTDADTVVPRSWALDHLRHADHGADAVAGPVDLDDPDALSPLALRRYLQVLEDGAAAGHAYAANLGVRADPFLEVGGFPVVTHGEEHALLDRLRARGHRVVSPPEVRARTSSRRRGRAEGGLADLLDRLHESRPA